MMVHENAFAYSMTTLAATMMHSIFNFYYVKIFLHLYRISEAWFNVAQVIFLVWNAINDPLFGYIQDTSKWELFRNRRKAILYGAPIFALSFLLPWFPWVSWASVGTNDWLVGFHLIVSLCFYDALFTFVLLAHCALFAELSKNLEDRHIVLRYRLASNKGSYSQWINLWSEMEKRYGQTKKIPLYNSQVASMLSPIGLFICVLVFHHEQENFVYFQEVCVVVALLSWLFMTFTGRNIQLAVDTSEQHDQETKCSSEVLPPLTLLKQLVNQKNLVFFVTMNFFQVFHGTFQSNFFLIFAEYLIGPDVLPAFGLSFIAGSSYVLPQIVALVSSSLLSKYGSYYLIMWSLYIKFGLATVVFMAGRQYIWLLAFMFLADRTLQSAASSLFNLPLADIVDSDMERYQRRSPVSSMIFGTNALFTKPAQSLAPMLVVFILNRYGYQKKGTPKSPQGSAEYIALQEVMFQLMCLVPLFLAVIQIIVWRLYTLRKSRHKKPLLGIEDTFF